MKAWAWAVGVAVMGVACGPTPAQEYGEALFNDPNLSSSQYNAFSCSTCHATSAQGADGKLFTGLSLEGAASRPTWWGGYELTLLDAVNFCYTAFMRGTTPLDAEDPKSRALYEYLVSLSPQSMVPAQPFTLVRDIAEVPRGDVARGAQVYQAACQECHGDTDTGQARLTPLAPVLPNVSGEYGQLFPNATPALVFIEKVRHGRFFGVGGNMPPYSLEALSDEDLGALLTYLGL